jgi:acyl carrier protein
MDNFLARVAEILEVDEVKPTDTLDGFEGWDSLSILSIIAMTDANYGVNLTAADIRSVSTAQELRDLIAAKHGQ